MLNIKILGLENKNYLSNTTLKYFSIAFFGGDQMIVENTEEKGKYSCQIKNCLRRYQSGADTILQYLGCDITYEMIGILIMK